MVMTCIRELLWLLRYVRQTRRRVERQTQRRAVQLAIGYDWMIEEGRTCIGF